MSTLKQKTTCRVRFAPSPTGPQHIGGIRTALFNWLFAQQQGGTFVVRIEDTDQKRFVPGAENYILDALRWLGIEPDEGPLQGGQYGPYRQSERKVIYQRYIEQLIERKKAYYAFDTAEELESMRDRLRAARIPAPQYNAISRMTMQNSLTLPEDEVRRRMAEGKPFVIRLKTDPKVTIKVEDQIRGWVSFKGNELDDKVLMKSDGLPTYHFANVIDDHLMKITDVIRGEEWLPSTPTHLQLYEGLGWQAPRFAHLPLLLKPDGKGKLSKRSAAQEGYPIFPLQWLDIAGFREKGFLPEALLNFLALLGWHPSGHQELFSLQELKKQFSLGRIGKAGVRFDLKKAKWINAHYMRCQTAEQLATKYLLPTLQKEKVGACTLEKATLICALIKNRLSYPQDVWKESKPFFIRPQTPLAEKFVRHWVENSKPWCQQLYVFLANQKDWDTVRIKEEIKGRIESEHLKVRDTFPLLRLAFTGLANGPDVGGILHILGKEESLVRLADAIDRWSNQVKI